MLEVLKVLRALKTLKTIKIITKKLEISVKQIWISFLALLNLIKL